MKKEDPKSDKAWDSSATGSYEPEERHEILLADYRIAVTEIGPGFKRSREADARAIHLLLQCSDEAEIELGKAELLFLEQSKRCFDEEQRIRIRIALDKIIAGLESKGGQR